jgi:hypothetical protein
MSPLLLLEELPPPPTVLLEEELKGAGRIWKLEPTSGC